MSNYKSAAKASQARKLRRYESGGLVDEVEGGPFTPYDDSPTEQQKARDARGDRPDVRDLKVYEKQMERNLESTTVLRQRPDTQRT